VPEAQLWQSTPAHFSWTNAAQLAEDLNGAVPAFAAAAHGSGKAWALVWCAGKGAVNSPAEVLEPEWWAWTRLLKLLSRHLARPRNNLLGYIFLASSTGGLYGGNLRELVSEYSPPQPVSEYGAHKFRMEEALRNWAEAFSNVSCLIGRISTLYGPGQDLRKAQGIIAHLSRCLIYRCPANIYVPLDTRRDYLFVDDCARQIAAGLRRLMSERPRVILKILASEHSTSLAQIVGVFFRIAKHRSLIVSRQASGIQSISLRFRSNIWRDLENRGNTELAVGIHLLHEYQLGLFQRGLLPPP
jgi:UDP-glucose 4-epimerase